MQKDIRFSASISTEAFDRAIEGMQRKLREIYQGSDSSRFMMDTKTYMARTGMGGKEPTAAEKRQGYVEDLKARNQAGQFIKEQFKELEKTIDQRKKEQKILEDIQKIKKKTVDQQNEYNRALERTTMLEKKIAGHQSAISQAQQMRRMPGFEGEGGWGGVFQRGAAAYGAGGARMGAAGLMRGANALRMASPLQFYGGIAGAAGAIMTGAGVIGEKYAESGRKVLSSQASAASAYSGPLMDSLTRNAFDAAVYSSESAEALKKASDEIKSKRRTDMLKLGGAVIGIVAGTALAAGGIAAAMTGVGAAPGAIATVKGSMMVAGGIAAASLALGGRGGITDRLFGTYESKLQEEQAQAYEQNLQSLKALAPIKGAAMQFYKKESTLDEPFLRELGLTNQEMNEIKTGGAGRGFISDTTRSAMGKILGAGGSTRAARGLATDVNLYERNLGLTNAGQVMGRLSALSGSGEKTDQAFIKILAESFGLGLDKSEYRQEQKKFMDVATSLAVREGAYSVEGQADIARRFSAFVSGPEMRQIEGAKGAFDLFKSQTGRGASGAQQAIGAAAIMKDPRLKNLDTTQMMALQALDAGQIGVDDPVIKGIMLETGMSSDEIIKASKIPMLTTGATKAESRLEELRKMPTGAPAKEKDILRGKLAADLSTEMGSAFSGLTPSEKEAYMDFLIDPSKMSPMDQKKAASIYKKIKQGKAKGPETAGAKIEGTEAAGDLAMFSILKKFQTEIEGPGGFIEKANVMAKSAERAAIALNKLGATEADKMIQALTKFISTRGEAPQGKSLVQEKGAPSEK